MPAPTPLDNFCDDHWNDTELEDFLSCVVGKMIERAREDCDGTAEDMKRMFDEYVGGMQGDISDLFAIMS